MNLIGTIVAVTDVWLIFVSLVTTANNFIGGMVFKFIPFMLGLANVVAALKLFNVI